MPFSNPIFRLKTAIPCPNCSGIAFCSLDCRSKALNTYHKFECHFLDLLIGSGMSVLCFAALRIVSQQDVKYFKDAQLDNDEENSHPYKQASKDISFSNTTLDIFLFTL